MATPDAPSISHYVNDAGAYVLSTSAIPDEHLQRRLIVHVDDGTVVDESTADHREEVAWCAWCEKSQSPTYLRREGHDLECLPAPGHSSKHDADRPDLIDDRPAAGLRPPHPAPAGKCRICGDDSWRADELGPAHPCRVIRAGRTRDDRAWRARHRANRAGGADATPSSSRREGVDNATPARSRMGPGGPMGEAGTGLPVSFLTMCGSGLRPATTTGFHGRR